MSGEDMRFSDTELRQLRTDFDEHEAREQAWRAEQEEKWNRMEERFDKLLALSESNNESIKNLIEETRGIVELHRELTGAARMGRRIQNFALWLAKWGVIGTGLTAIFNYAKKMFLD